MVQAPGAMIAGAREDSRQLAVKSVISQVSRQSSQSSVGILIQDYLNSKL